MSNHSVRDIFIRHDERREQWNIQPMGWVVGGLLVILVSAMTSGAWQVLSAPKLQVTPTVPATAIPPTKAGPEPTATSAVQGCPEDPAMWTLKPYSLPKLSREKSGPLYVIDPPCVMERIERAFAECADLKARQGRSWSQADEEKCYSTSGFTAILRNEDFLPLGEGVLAYGRCVETVKENGEPVTSKDLHFTFYTISEDKQVADLLVIDDTNPVVREYDCETGELIEEASGDPVQTGVIYSPMLFEDGRWRRGYRPDIVEVVPSDKIDPANMISLVRSAQGR